MADLRERFKAWWAVNHPHDWYAAERGEPISHEMRLIVWAEAKRAWQAAYALALDDAIALAKRNLGMTAQEYAQAIEALKP